MVLNTMKTGHGDQLPLGGIISKKEGTLVLDLNSEGLDLIELVLFTGLVGVPAVKMEGRKH